MYVWLIGLIEISIRYGTLILNFILIRIKPDHKFDKKGWFLIRWQQLVSLQRTGTGTVQIIKHNVALFRESMQC